MLNRARQPFPGGAALFTQIGPQRANCVKKRILLLLEVGAPRLPIAQRFQLILGALAKGYNLLKRVAVLAPE